MPAVEEIVRQIGIAWRRLGFVMHTLVPSDVGSTGPETIHLSPAGAGQLVGCIVSSPACSSLIELWSIRAQILFDHIINEVAERANEIQGGSFVPDDKFGAALIRLCLYAEYIKEWILHPETCDFSYRGHAYPGPWLKVVDHVDQELLVFYVENAIRAIRKVNAELIIRQLCQIDILGDREFLHIFPGAA